jgi:hypothetical protein
MKQIIFFSFIFLLLCSCNKEIEYQHEDSVKARTTNPLNYFGDSHNSRMDYIQNMSGFDTASVHTIFTYSTNYSDTYFNSYTGDWMKHIETIDICTDIANNTIDPSDALLKDSIITLSMKKYVKKIDSLFDNSINFSSQTIKTSSQFTNEIESIEALIMNEYPCTISANGVGDEGAFLLGACAIAKKSFDYWAQVTSDSTDSWNIKLNSITSLPTDLQQNQIEVRDVPKWLKKAWRGVKVAAVDVWGFMTAKGCAWDDANGHHYDLFCAWDYAGEKSSSIP